MELEQLETPCLIVDLAKVKKNMQRVRQHIESLGVRLRPHGKSVKNHHLMRMAQPDSEGPITVSTVKEAEHYFEHGYRDILYAVGIEPGKLPRLHRLMKGGAQIKIILDGLQQAKSVSRWANDHQVSLPVLIEIDCDGHRSGVEPASASLVQLGSYLQDQGPLEMAGIITHAGESYHCHSVSELRDMANQERDAAVASTQALADNNIACPIVSVGSTPTACFAEDLTGVTEVRAGVYMFQDLVMCRLGVCAIEDIGLSVLTTVVGHQVAKGWAITDSGWSALSRDKGIPGQFDEDAYGRVCSVKGQFIAGAKVIGTNQEHGILIDCDATQSIEQQYPFGTKLRVLPIHACAMAGMHTRYVVTDGSNEVIANWERVHGW